MGLLMRNGVAYAGSNSIELTQAEYNALVSAGTVQPDTFYCIVDADNVFPASDVTYDNTDSGLSANRVQSAIDEVKSALATLDKHSNRLYLKSYTTYDSGSGGNITFLRMGHLGVAILWGYTFATISTRTTILSNIPETFCPWGTQNNFQVDANNAIILNSNGTLQCDKGYSGRQVWMTFTYLISNNTFDDQYLQ